MSAARTDISLGVFPHLLLRCSAQKVTYRDLTGQRASSAVPTVSASSAYSSCSITVHVAHPALLNKQKNLPYCPARISAAMISRRNDLNASSRAPVCCRLARTRRSSVSRRHCGGRDRRRFSYLHGSRLRLVQFPPPCWGPTNLRRRLGHRALLCVTRGRWRHPGPPSRRPSRPHSSHP